MHVVCVLFEIPAAWNMFKLHLNYPQKKQARKIPIAFLIPYKDMKYLPILILTILNGIISGVAGSYLVLYLLEDLKFSMTLVTIIGFAMGILINITLPLCGKITDKVGYRFLFLLLASGMLIGFSLFSIFWGALWILPLFAVLAWSGSGSLCGGWLTWGLQAAGSRL